MTADQRFGDRDVARRHRRALRTRELRRRRDRNERETKQPAQHEGPLYRPNGSLFSATRPLLMTTRTSANARASCNGFLSTTIKSASSPVWMAPVFPPSPSSSAATVVADRSASTGVSPNSTSFATSPEIRDRL